VCNDLPEFLCKYAIMEHTIHQGLIGTKVGTEVFTDLDRADDVVVLAEMLDVLLLVHHVLQAEAVKYNSIHC